MEWILTEIRPDAPQPIFHKVDLRDASTIEEVFAKYDQDGGIWAVIHLAALKAVGESGEIPLSYYRVNVGGSISLLEVGFSFQALYCRIAWDPASISAAGDGPHVNPLTDHSACRNTAAGTLFSRLVRQSTVPLLSFRFPNRRPSPRNQHTGGQKRWSRISCRTNVELLLPRMERKVSGLSASGTSSKSRESWGNRYLVEVLLRKVEYSGMVLILAPLVLTLRDD